MTIYVLDTDRLSLYGRNHPTVITRLRAARVQLTTTAINVEELSWPGPNSEAIATGTEDQNRLRHRQGARAIWNDCALRLLV